MSFNINMQQPQKPKISMKDKGSVTDTIGFDGNALSQKPKEVTDVEFGNSARDNLLQKEIDELKKEFNKLKNEVNELKQIINR